MAGLPLVVSVFAAVAAEALWNCRAWCARAFVAYCGVGLLQPLAGVMGIGGSSASLGSFGMNVFFAVMAAGYVDNRAAQLLGSSAQRIPMPAARP